MVSGGPVDMQAWKNNAKGIVQAWYAGMEGGNALAEVLFGEINEYFLSSSIGDSFFISKNYSTAQKNNLDRLQNQPKLNMASSKRLQLYLP